MFRTQVYLTENEREKLILLSQELGQHQSALIREAIDQFIESKLMAKRNKHQIFKSAAGIWENREDLPDFSSLRKEFDRNEL
jgi:hypothetical protein